jgi:hypothetical protein
VARHETYLFNPSMFGRPIYDHAQADQASVRRCVEKKSRIIARFAPASYVETSHAFLKSYFDVAPEYFPELSVVHLVRHPLKVAKSQVNRERLASKLPFSHYRAPDGRKYFRWSLTGLEGIFQQLDVSRLTRFQWYLIEWIEIENRAARFMEQNRSQGGFVTLRVPEDVNEQARVLEMFQRLSVSIRRESLDLSGWRNRTPGHTTLLTDEDQRQFGDLLQQIPPTYLAILRRPPYTHCDWSHIFQ